MAEYRLSYTASEIDSKLGKVNKLSDDVGGLQADTESLQTDVGTLNNNVGVLQGNVRTLETNIQTKAEIVTLTTAEYDALGDNFNANNLYVLTDSEENENGGNGEAVLYTPQTLSNEQQAQARENIGAISSSLLDGFASEIYVNEQIANLVNSAPEKLNTLDELAAALGDDENFANTVTTELSKKANVSDLNNYATKKELNEATVTCQNKITGTYGDFVVIGADGSPTTKALIVAEEVYF